MQLMKPFTLLTIVMTLNGAWVLRYTDDTVAWLNRPLDYVGAVLGPDTIGEAAP